MRTLQTVILCCPACGAPELVREPELPAGGEPDVRNFTDSFRCGCGCLYPVRDGVPDLRLPGSQSPAPEFSAERLRIITEIEALHFWFAGRRAWLDAMMDRYLGTAQTALDLGCGSGFNARQLSHRGLKVVALDERPEGLRELARTASGITAIQADARHLPFSDGSFDAVVMLDVIEHTDDTALLNEVHRVLRRGGMLFLTVPALPWLWSQRDEAAGHRRRYTRAGLKRLLGSERLEVRQIGWYQCWLFPLALATRLAARWRHKPVELEERIFPVINSLFSRISRLEARMGTRVSWPWGSSLAAVCQKADSRLGL
ncbi:MAG: methyltransferase domain-containing protein [Thermoleophilia bacterium]